MPTTQRELRVIAANTKIQPFTTLRQEVLTSFTEHHCLHGPGGTAGGEHYGRSCDVWSIGCSIIEMVTASPPWDAKETASSRKSPPLPHNLSDGLRDLSRKCLKLSGAERPSTWDLLQHAGANCNYTSEEIMREMVLVLSDGPRGGGVFAALQKSPYYSIMIDQTTDISERTWYLAIRDIPDGKADTIVEKLKEFLKVGEATIRMLRAHNTNVREYKDDTRKIVKFISAPGQLVHCPFNPAHVVKCCKVEVHFRKCSKRDAASTGEMLFIPGTLQACEGLFDSTVCEGRQDVTTEGQHLLLVGTAVSHLLNLEFPARREFVTSLIFESRCASMLQRYPCFRDPSHLQEELLRYCAKPGDRAKLDQDRDGHLSPVLYIQMDNKAGEYKKEHGQNGTRLPEMQDVDKPKPLPTIVQRGDVVSKYIGQTTEVTRKKIDKSRGGVMVIDEAYRLAQAEISSSKDVGKEALEELMSVIEDGDSIMIFAGYPEEMVSFLEVDPGMKFRVAYRFHFPDFSVEELAEIMRFEIANMGLNRV
ncbi:hypothetical protein Bbelb_109170 [Branchiostoma belcheri]|nr:hypothetical protein Bbelb_109170 [Branchiostoma belcheri]